MTNDDVQKLQQKADDSKVALVLIIEDNPVEQRLFSLIEQSVGMISCVVTTSEEALDAIKCSRFNLILLNLRMPDAQAVACASKIRLYEMSQGIRTPIIAVTANAMPGDRELCIEAGMDDYLAKPFLVQRLKQLITQWAA